MDSCIRIAVVTTAILTYTATARTFHNHQNFHGWGRHHDGYEWNHHGQWPNHQSWEEPHRHHSRDFSHYPTNDFSHYPSKDYENSPQSRQNSEQTQEDMKGDSEEFWGDFYGSEEDSKSKSWEGGKFAQQDEDNKFPTPLWSKMQAYRIERSPQVNNMQPASASITTQSPLAITLCMRTCQVTSEYNPVCGSNNVTYNNPGRLECAQNCGVDVTLQRQSTCTRPIPAVTNAGPSQGPTTPPATNPTTTPRQPITNAVKPTRFTTIEVNPGSTTSPESVNPGTNGFTIPQNVLESIFTTPPTEVDDIDDVDIRHERRQRKLN